MPAAPRAASVWPSNPGGQRTIARNRRIACNRSIAAGPVASLRHVTHAARHAPCGGAIASPSEFAAALKGRRLARGAFIVSASPCAPADDQPARARLGLVIAKRFAARAVTRNTLKRVIREAFRARRLALPAQDYVVRLHSKLTPASLTALKRSARAEVDAHFTRIAR